MSLKPLLEYAIESEELASLGLALQKGRQRAFVSASLRPYLLASLIEADYGAVTKPAIVITGDDLAARDLSLDLETLLAPRPVRYYPSRGVTYESHLAPPPHLVGLRIGALDVLDDWSDRATLPPVVTISSAALSERVPDPQLRPHGMHIHQGGEIDLDETVEKLVTSGYERVGQVEERGHFAVRGGILDLYPATEARAVRCELFGDEVERLTWLSTFSQRSLGDVESVEVAPAAELGLEYRELVELAAEEAKAGERVDVADVLPLDSFTDLATLLPDNAFGVVAEEEEIDQALDDRWQDVSATLDESEIQSLYIEPEVIQRTVIDMTTLAVSAVSQDQPHEFRAQRAEPAARSIEKARPELEKLITSGYTTVVAWARRSEAERASHNLAGLKPSELTDRPPKEGELVFTHANLNEGFIAPQFKLALIPDHRLLRKSRAERPAPSHKVLQEMSTLKVGDYVTHEDHGIARLAGFDTKTVDEVTRDYFFLEFGDSASVYVPFDQMAKVSRYVGADGSPPVLSKLGGKRWDMAKSRARKVAQELAGELINLYAERKSKKGTQFEPDSSWQRQFEQAFSYHETDDQVAVIEDVKADMESEQPMDRLLCGDVGYGKTEVALRAAFKCASQGKQVMMLVPTTVLAQQHLGTFEERLHDFPINVESVSRFNSQAHNSAVLKGLSEGKVDVLIGTHRLLSRDVVPKDVGLLIIDEEQRFGVKQKELLRQLKLKVDVLTMTATPIPRTLQMAVEGLRDISVIDTPPEGRRPVKTYVGAYDEELVKRALKREKKRGGQSFFLHNRVGTIEETAERLRALCPEIRFEVAHGQMDETVLEMTMLEFLQGGADCLVCTTIVESGLDIPQANTLIIDTADKLGLAQLYQIRGRVGRSRATAYAYLLYPSARSLTHEASARLAALSDYTELGSGFRVAMRDMEIRGAGSLLGDEQSGHVAAIGFELYYEMLEQEIEKRSGDQTTTEPDAELVRLDVAVDAYLPSDYIPFEAAKVDIHRRVAGTTEVVEIKRIRDEMKDRFGQPPPSAQNLLLLQEVRLKLGLSGALSVTIRADRFAAAPIEMDSTQVKALRKKLPRCIYKSSERTVSLQISDQSNRQLAEVLEVADAILEAKASI